MEWKQPKNIFNNNELMEISRNLKWEKNSKQISWGLSEDENLSIWNYVLSENSFSHEQLENFLFQELFFS